MFLTRVERPSPSFIGRVGQLLMGRMYGVRAYDPLDGFIHKMSLQELIEEELSMVRNKVILSSDLENQFLNDTKRKSGYTRVHFLSDIKYMVNEGFIKRIGKIQQNAYDCGPLVVYAALQSKH